MEGSCASEVLSEPTGKNILKTAFKVAESLLKVSPKSERLAKVFAKPRERNFWSWAITEKALYSMKV